MSLLHAEYLKLSRRKLYPIMLGALVALTLMLGFFFIVFAQNFPDLAEGVPLVPRPFAYIFGAQQVATQTWFPMILGVVLLGSELASTVWATSLTRNPSKLRHVSARLTMFTLASWLAYVVGTGVFAVMTTIWGIGSGGPTPLEWLDLAWRLGAVALVWTALGLAAVALIRSVGPAIGVGIGFLFLDQIIGFWATYQNISLFMASNALFGHFVDGPLSDVFPGSGISSGHALAVLAGWTALAFFLTWLGLSRRDA